MQCNNCSILELEFEIKVTGDTNTAALPQVIEHMERRGISVKAKKQRLIVPETGAKEFMDFCRHFMDVEQVVFRINRESWQAFAEIETVMDMQWIDEVIQKELLTCHYQPIVDTNGKIFAYEMLARFQNEDGSVIYPGEIFPAAKSRGRLYALDRVCRMAAVKYAAVLNDAKAFINFIPTSIYSPEFCLRSTTLLANQLGIDPEQLVFEVVETEQVEDLEHLKTILAYYKEKGFEYALDDVGEGYSTIEMLSDLKPKYMKLDMQYVQGVSGDSAKQQIALQFLEKALEVGSVPLAEGIEERVDFEWLKQHGYQLFQGYYFGKPAARPMEVNLTLLG